MMEDDAKRRLKSAELQAKKNRLRIWTNYVPPATNSKAIHDQNFTGKVIVHALSKSLFPASPFFPSYYILIKLSLLSSQVVEVVSGDCIIVADDSIPYGSPLAERRVNLSSIRCPKIGNPRREEKPAPYAREAREFLRTRLIGRQVCIFTDFVFLVCYYSKRALSFGLFLSGECSNGVFQEGWYGRWTHIWCC